MCALGAIGIGTLAHGALNNEPGNETEKEPKLETGLVADAKTLVGLFESDLAHEMLEQVHELPMIESKQIHIAVRPNRGYTESEFEMLDESEKKGLQVFEVDPERYYTTFYGSPLVYARAFDLIDQHAPGFEINNSRIMDLGYGQLGQLRLWGQMGAHVIGVEIDPILRAMYEDCEALGPIDHSGSVELVHGAWPNEKETREEVGEQFDLIVSRNLLKKGYVKPAALNPKFPIPVAWGMSDLEAVSHFYDALAPGGLVVIESLGPKPDPEKPWSDIKNPWSKQAWIDAGFEVLAHDKDESEYARSLGKALGWDAQMNLEQDLFGVYSVYRKPIE